MVVTVKLDSDIVSNIVRDELIESLRTLERDLASYDNPDHGWIAVFDTDEKKDRKELAKMIKSVKRVINYYSVPGEEIE